jgi:hypothetical protein
VPDDDPVVLVVLVPDEPVVPVADDDTFDAPPVLDAPPVPVVPPVPAVPPAPDDVDPPVVDDDDVLGAPPVEPVLGRYLASS